MSSPVYQIEEQRKRRELWFSSAREISREWFHADGRAKLTPQFGSPYREPLWAAAALYTGSQADIDLINRVIGRWFDAPRSERPGERESHGTDFGIFQTNTMIHLYHRFHDRLSPGAEKVMRHHVEKGPKTFFGSGQPDTKYHGANDNMPTMATQGLIFAGEILGDDNAIKHGLWYLNKLRLLLSRSAWISEFNSSTYSPVTLSHVAQLACFSKTAEVRELALELEQRLWAELILHYHPGTFMQAGPQSRAYMVDFAGHTHSLQVVFWAVFGAEIAGRDPLRTFFRPDGCEVIHFAGCTHQSIAEMVHFLDGDFHPPAELASLMTQRNYPALLQGRSEAMGVFDLSGQLIHTTTYMEEDFSLGTSDVPWNVNQSANFYVTYRRKPVPIDFRNAGTAFLKYCIGTTEHGAMERSEDGLFEGERFVSNQGWLRTLQKDNVALITATPRLEKAPLETDVLRLDLVFPVHYGKISRTIIGDGPTRDGAVGESAEIVPVSIEAGEVYIHVAPLLPTNLPRRAALRFTQHNDRYETLELVNYEGPKRAFSRNELELAANGCVITVESRKKDTSLEDFHRAKSRFVLTDYLLVTLRFLEFERADIRFDLTYGPRTGTVMTEAINGRAVPRPIFKSNQLDPSKLPFMTGPVKPNFSLFPWKDNLDICWYPGSPWIIGSRGLSGEKPYSQRVEAPRPEASP